MNKCSNSYFFTIKVEIKSVDFSSLRCRLLFSLSLASLFLKDEMYIRDKPHSPSTSNSYERFLKWTNPASFHNWVPKYKQFSYLYERAPYFALMRHGMLKKVGSVTTLGDLLDFVLLFKPFWNNYFAQILHILREFL